MKIKIKSFAMIREILGNEEIYMDIEKDMNLFDLLKSLTDMYSELSMILFDDNVWNQNFVILIDDEVISPEEFNIRTFDDGNKMIILPPSGGG
ncbi:MAG: MoaD/ThiS family protein [Candidatus Kariarchaeum pelagius]